jgi:hypothetical protein
MECRACDEGFDAYIRYICQRCGKTRREHSSQIKVAGGDPFLVEQEIKPLEHDNSEHVPSVAPPTEKREQEEQEEQGQLPALPAKSLSQEAVRAIFDEFDADRSGAIDATEFEVVSYALGETLTKEEVAAAVAVLDTNKTGSHES